MSEAFVSSSHHSEASYLDECFSNNFARKTDRCEDSDSERQEEEQQCEEQETYAQPEPEISFSSVQIEKRFNYQVPDRQQRDRERNIGKISTRDASVEFLGPLPECPKKVCPCKDFIHDKLSQKMLRNEYVETVKSSESRDAGNLFLLQFIVIVPIIGSRKRKRKIPLQVEGEEPKRIIHRSNCAYQVPTFENEDGALSGFATICQHTFMNLFGFSPKRLQTLKGRKKNIRECSQFRFTPRGRKGHSETVWENLKRVLETEHRETNPRNRTYYYCGKLNLFHFWKKYLTIYGTDNDKSYLEQAQKKKFYPTYNYESKCRRKPSYSDLEPKLRPSVAYSTASRFWQAFDIRFILPRCNKCEACQGKGLNYADDVSPEELHVPPKEASQNTLLFEKADKKLAIAVQKTTQNPQMNVKTFTFEW